MAKTPAARKQRPVILCAGGTGGHLFPAEALAAELLSRNIPVVIFTDKRGHAFKSLGDRAPIHIIRAATLKPGLSAKIRALFEMGLGILGAAKKLVRLKPAVVVGFGGYPSFPGTFAAQLLRIPTILHEQNAVLGKANVWLANGAKKIALSLEGTKGMTPRQVAKTIVTGNPVRDHIITAGKTPYKPPLERFCILITGGSQAANIFGAIVPESLKNFTESQKSRFYVMHQCREEACEIIQKTYDDIGVKAETASFFNNMAERLADCQLFIGRSGASTVAEIAVAGRPAIFVPYPGHSDMQQKHNADIIADKGGAWVMLQPDFTPEALAAKIGSFLDDPALLAQAAAAAATCGKPDAAKRLADLVLTEVPAG